MGIFSAPVGYFGFQKAVIMSSYEGVLVSDQWLQSQFTQVELRGLKSNVSIRFCSSLCNFFFFNKRLMG